MALLVINTDQFIGALCNTLVHSLWQGLLLSAIAGLIIIFTKRATSALRYTLLISTLVLFAIGVCVTFMVQFKPVQNIATGLSVQIVQVPSAAKPIIDYPNTPIAATGFSNLLFGYLNNHHNTIVLIWFMIICAKSIQLAVGLLGTYRLKRTNVLTVSNYWNEKMQQLANQLSIKQTINLLESGLAKVPMVIGNLKPVILIPIGLLTAMSAEEVEAILIHELAHIKRRDYLVNLLQCLMEIIFFFNPAVLWVSQLIRAERENCCDDLVLAQSSNKVNYIRALVSCEEYQSAVPAYAMGFPGGKSSLFDRVKRMANNSNHSLNLFEKTVLAVCLVASGLCLSAFAEKEKIARTVNTIVNTIKHIEVNKVQQQELVGQNVLLKRQSDKLKQNTALLNAEKNILSADHDTIIPRVRAQTLTTPQPKVTVESQVKVNNVVTKEVNTTVRLDSMKTHLSGLNVSLGDFKVTTNVKTNVKLNLKVDTTENYTNTYNKKYEYKNDARLTYKNDVKLNSQHGYKPDSTIRYPKLANKISLKLHIPKMADALYDAGLIKDKANFSALLTNDVLMVNGVKQSEENHQRILKKYQEKPGDKVNLSFTYTGK